MKKFTCIIMLIAILLFPTAIFAAGNAKLDLSSSSASTSTSANASVGGNVTLYARVSDFGSNGIVSAAGEISYDHEYLQFVSANGIVSSWSNKNNVKSNGNIKFSAQDPDYTLPSAQAVYSFTFKALKNGSTDVTLSGAEVATNDEILSTSGSNATVRINIGNSSPSSKSSDASLKSLSITNGNIDFSSDNTTYNVEVENNVESITVSATANDSKATVTGAGAKSLSVGNNKIEVKVVAEDGTTSRTYTINVNRKGSGNEGEGEGNTPTPEVDDNRSSDNNLKSLEVPGHSLSPEFSSDNTSYSIEVDNNVTSIDVNALTNDSKANVTVLGNSGFSIGVNNVNVVVTAEDGSQKVYSIKVVRKGDNNQTSVDTSKSSENRLRSIFVANGTLTPAFNSDNTSYDIVIANDVNELDLTATPIDSKARVQIANNGDFKVGETKTVQVTVTAEDGSQKIYTINVKKSEIESNNKLSNITIDGAPLTPSFNPNTTVYTSQVGSGVKSIKINATPQNENAKVEYSVNGSEFKSDGNLDLQDGNNVVIVKVTDENGFVQMYTVNIEKKSSTFELFGLKIPKWLGYVLLGLLLLIIGWLVFLVLKRRKKHEEKAIQATQAIPNIEIKPEFNFGSKNEDNDTVEDGGVLNQASSGAKANTEDHDKEYQVGYDRPKEIPYDPYDEIVTKEEIIDAINEKDPEKLKMLYKQEMLNREKEKLKEKEEAKVVEYEEERKED